MEAVKEMGRFDRSGTKILAEAAMKQHEGKILTDEQQAAKDSKDAKEKDFIWNKVIQIQKWQMERLILHYDGKPYEHIDKNWKPKEIALPYGMTTYPKHMLNTKDTP